MDRAIKFYEDLLGIKIKHREKDSWADFYSGDEFYLGLINPKIISNRRIIGNNSIPVFFADDIDAVYKKVKKWKVEITFPPEDLPFTTYRYHCFGCKDTEGNIIEIANYEKYS